MQKTAFVYLSALILFFTSAVTYAETHGDVRQHKACRYCGMDREKFDYSRMLIEYDDGTSTGVCSLHCAAVELATTLDKTPRAIRVADLNSRQLIDAEKALWVMGGSRPGVMSKRGKWAFSAKEDAESFIRTNGGALVMFEDAIKAAYEDMYEDTKMIRDRRKMKRMHSTGHEHKH